MYRKNLNVGGWFSFNSDRENWKKFYALKMANHFFDVDRIKRKFKGFDITEELLITKNLQFSGILDKKILVIGGGPSTSSLTQETINSYDYVFSCNHFYLNPLLREQKIHVVLIGDEVDLEDKRFTEYLKKFQPIVGFEHSSKRTTLKTIQFNKQYKRSFIYLTRYFSRLGYVARACILARCMGASHIDFIGMDGFKTTKHAFEKQKSLPPFNSEEKFKEQARIFYHYVIEDLKLKNFTNLAESNKDSIYYGILTEIKNEKN